MNTFIEAKTLAQQEKRDEACDLLFAFPEQFLTSEVLVFRAILMQLTDKEYSLEFIENEFLQALILNAESIEAHYELGMFYDAVMNDSQNALKHFNSAKQILEKQLAEVERGIQDCIDFVPKFSSERLSTTESK